MGGASCLVVVAVARQRLEALGIRVIMPHEKGTDGAKRGASA